MMTFLKKKKEAGVPQEAAAAQVRAETTKGRLRACPSRLNTMKIYTFDTTLRDGTQGESVSFSVEDKLLIAQKLDELGIDYIEGGWPGSNPKDKQFFERATELKLKHAETDGVRLHPFRAKSCRQGSECPGTASRPERL